MAVKRPTMMQSLSSATSPKQRAWLSTLLGLLGILFSTTLAYAQGQAVYQMDIPGPTGSGAFGKQVVVLTNGNIVVADPDFNSATANKVGAVYLYDGETLALISMLTGSSENDQVGLGYNGGASGVTALSNGNFVVSSPSWNGYAGAVTWGSGVTGVSGTVSAGNSLVGRTNQRLEGDLVGADVLALNNGNYVVGSPYWDDGGVAPGNAGAATWGNGATGITGFVSTANSLIGGEPQGFVGAGLRLLSNGNYLVLSLNAGKGAVTWGNAATGITGTVSAANSLVGSKLNDGIGSGTLNNPGLVPLNNGNYVVVSPVWDNGAVVDAGAVTWGNGATGTRGVVSSANSLVGTRPYDNVGYGGNGPGVVPLTNGNFLVVSYIWDSASVSDAGAVTWANGATGRSGIVSAANSLIGSSPNDYVGFIPNCYCSGVAALSNGNYVVASPDWDNGATYDVGAVTWGNGATGRVGTISSANSLVGDTSGDKVGLFGIVALPSGNYLARSPYWHSERGAITWGNGATGIAGAVSAANSLIGNSPYDTIGLVDHTTPSLGVTVLSNGNYVISSPFWDKTWLSEPNFGAVTWGNGATGITGAVTAANSLIGSSPNDKVGLLREGNPFTGITTLSGVIPLSNGHFVAASGYWDHGATVDAGAVTRGNGTTGITGVVTAANSLVGSSDSDQVGLGGVTALGNGSFVVASPYWDNGGMSDVGAATWVGGAASVTGVVSAANSLVGSNSYDLVGSDGATALANGNYVVRSHFWSNLATGNAEVGAVTWGSGVSGVHGPVSAANSLLGSSDADWVGVEPPKILSNGDYIVPSPKWDNGTSSDAGAVTWGNGVTATAGVISSSNSVLGTTTNQGETMTSQAANNNLRIIVGRDVDQIVTVVERVPRLTVRLAGSGAGTVSSTPPGIACGADCSEPFNYGTVVTLSATPTADSIFTGWTGACTGTGACLVTMNSVKSVTVTFTRLPPVQRSLFLPAVQHR